MVDGLDEIPGAAVSRKWREIATFIDQLNYRASYDADAFPVAPESSLADDDRAGSPFRVSVIVRSCINAGVDHLHALKALVDDAGLLHVAAPFSLARGGLENFAAASWVLSGDSREVRVERALRWHAQDVKDGNRAMGDLRLPGSRSLPEQWALLDAVADRHNLGRGFRSGYLSSEVVKAAESTFPALRLGVLRPWQLCSGFAHGRPWALHGASHQDRSDGDDPDMVTIRLNSSLLTVLHPTLAAVELSQALLRLYNDRASTSG